MSILERLTEDMKSAMKNKDKLRLDTIRQLRAQLKDVAIAKRDDLTDEEQIAALTTAAKKRREAIELYKKGGRDELAEQEANELAVIQDYLPQQLSEDELTQIVAAAVEKTGASSPAEFGKVMGMVMGQVKGRADGKMVQQIVRSML